MKEKIVSAIKFNPQAAFAIIMFTITFLLLLLAALFGVNGIFTKSDFTIRG